MAGTESRVYKVLHDVIVSKASALASAVALFRLFYIQHGLE